MLISSYPLCSCVILLYSYVLAKAIKKRNTLYMQMLLALFIVSQVLWCAAITILVMDQNHYILSMSVFGVYNSMYSLAHWVFAFHYYSSAVCLDSEEPPFY